MRPAQRADGTMAEPRPFQFDSRQRSVGTAGGRRRVAWPWIALSLAVHGAIILFALAGAARGGHTALLGTLEVTVVGAPSAGDPGSRSAEGDDETKSEPAAVPRPEAPPDTSPDPAAMPQPSAVPQPAAAMPPAPEAPQTPAKPDVAAPPAGAVPPREAATMEAAPRAPSNEAAVPPKQPERVATPDPLALPRKAIQAEAAPQGPRSGSDPALKRPEAPAPAQPQLPRKAERAEKAPAEPRLAEAPRAPAPSSAPAKAARAGVKQAPKGQTASLGAPTGGDRLGRSDSDDTGGLLNVNFNPRFRAPPSPPVYPRQSIERDEEGVVLVRALVDPSGAPQRVLIHKGSGFRLLDEAALEAVRRWRFEPMVRDGRATSAWVQVPVRFRLN
jgi:protein TonB